MMVPFFTVYNQGYACLKALLRAQILVGQLVGELIGQLKFERVETIQNMLEIMLANKKR